jgi:acyl dehydratase
MAVRTLTLDELNGMKGQEIGVTDWHPVTQEEINKFAAATHDHQWIHVDPERAAAGPFGGTIAHGYLTLSLASSFIEELLQVDGIAMAINYGLNRVRFPAPVPVGSRVRAGAEVTSVDEVQSGVLQCVVTLTFEREGGDKPVCVAESVSRFIGAG